MEYILRKQRFIALLLFFLTCNFYIIITFYNNDKTWENDNKNINPVGEIRKLKIHSDVKIENQLIYFGSNSSLSATFNTEDKLQQYAYSTNSSLIKRFPQVIGIGTPKCGTSALVVFFNHHPLLKATRTEPRFFSKYYDDGFDKYLSMMPYTTNNQITIEKTPGLVSSDEKLKRVRNFDPSIKLLFSVREPVVRSISHYVHFQIRNYDWRASFKKAFYGKTEEISTGHSTIDFSMYAKNFKRALKYFKRDQIHIIDGDKLMFNPQPELEKIETFLNVENYFTPEKFHFNQTKGFSCFRQSANSPDLCAKNSKDNVYEEISAARNINATDLGLQLKRFFAPHNLEFYEIAGQRFDWD